MKTVNLDDAKTYQTLDPSHMLGRLRGLPQQCLDAYQKALALELPPRPKAFKNIVVLGMGGSAIGGDLLRDLLALEPKAPQVWVNRDYTLPSFVGRGTLVVASSYSGETEETLSTFRQALTTKATLLAITRGGTLQTLTEEHGILCLPVDWAGEPRTAVGYMFLSLVGLCQHLGILRDVSKDLADALGDMRSLLQEVDAPSPSARNPAKALAQRLYGRIGVVYGAGFLSAAAYRLKTQLNENAKAWAFSEVLPELDHNSVVGYQFPPQARENLYVVFLRSPLLHPRILKRQEVTAALLKQANIPYQFLEARGSNALSHMLSLVLLGDFTSYYLALLNGIDPSPVKAIDFLKQRLASPQAKA